MGITKIIKTIDGANPVELDLSFDVSNLLPGNHALKVEMFDGTVSKGSQTKNVFVAAAAPVMATPTNGQVISEGGNVNMTIASYPTANSVSYYSGTTLLGTSTTAPNFPVTYPNAPLGTYAIHAVAIVNGVTSPDSEIVTITVEVVTSWAAPIVDAYETRVLADYGTVEDKAALLTYLQS